MDEYLYHPSDFETLGDTVSFVRDLRVPIPPAISALEITAYQVSGSAEIVTHILYRAALVGAFLAAIGMASSSPARLLGSSVLSVVFLWGVTIVHPGNAQVYDILYPLFGLSFILLLGIASRATSPGWALLILCAAVGISASMAELTRPFVILILPVWLLGGYQVLKGLPWRYHAAFLAPIVVISGACTPTCSSRTAR